MFALVLLVKKCQWCAGGWSLSFFFLYREDNIIVLAHFFFSYDGTTLRSLEEGFFLAFFDSYKISLGVFSNFPSAQHHRYDPMQGR